MPVLLRHLDTLESDPGLGAYRVPGSGYGNQYMNGGPIAIGVLARCWREGSWTAPLPSGDIVYLLYSGGLAHSGGGGSWTGTTASGEPWKVAGWNDEGFSLVTTGGWDHWAAYRAMEKARAAVKLGTPTVGSIDELVELLAGSSALDASLGRHEKPDNAQSTATEGASGGTHGSEAPARQVLDGGQGPPAGAVRLGLVLGHGEDGDDHLLADITLLDSLLAALNARDLRAISRHLGKRSRTHLILDWSAAVPLDGSTVAPDSSDWRAVASECVMKAAMSAASILASNMGLTERCLLAAQGTVEFESSMDWNAVRVIDSDALQTFLLDANLLFDPLPRDPLGVDTK
jgi:hypothetical protein